MPMSERRRDLRPIRMSTLTQPTQKTNQVGVKLFQLAFVAPCFGAKFVMVRPATEPETKWTIFKGPGTPALDASNPDERICVFELPVTWLEDEQNGEEVEILTLMWSGERRLLLNRQPAHAEQSVDIIGADTLPHDAVGARIPAQALREAANIG